MNSKKKFDKLDFATDIIAETESFKEEAKKDKKLSHYINNKTLLQEIILYKEELEKFKEGKIKVKPQVSNYIGSCILAIAERLSSKPNFYGYSFREEMLGDGIENCMMYLNNFDPKISENPFAYFTQIIWFAFLRRIQKEKKQAYIRMKMFQNMDKYGVIKDYIETTGELEGKNDNIYAEYFKLSELDVNYFDNKSQKKKCKKPKSKNIKTNLDEFME